MSDAIVLSSLAEASFVSHSTLGGSCSKTRAAVPGSVPELSADPPHVLQVRVAGGHRGRRSPPGDRPPSSGKGPKGAFAIAGTICYSR
jgi:hypothetical protein